MNRLRLLILVLVCLVLIGLDAACAHEIHLKNGRVIKTTIVNREDGLVTYEQFGGLVSISLSEVAQIRYDSSQPKQALPADEENTAAGQPRSEDKNLKAELSAALAPQTPIERANLAVVSIKTEAGYGSGFFISDDGLIVTNRHVVRGSESNNRQVEHKIDKAEGQFDKWRRNLEKERENLSRQESSQKKKWQTYKGIINDPQRMVSPEDRQEIESNLRARDQYLKEWRHDYEERRRAFLGKSREFNQEKKEFYVKNEQLARQSRFTIVLADGSEKSAVLYRVSDKYDLALLKLNGFSTPYLRPARDKSAASLGGQVFAIGSPLQFNNSVTAGAISNFRGDYIQTDARIYPGNSGGPLVTVDGHVLGVNTMKVITEKFEGLGFAIQFDRVRSEFADYLAPH